MIPLLGSAIFKGTWQLVGRWPTMTLLAAISLVGCGRTPADLPDTFPVTGRVLHADDHPLAGGAIYLRNAEHPALEAIGEIASDGSFSLYTMFEGQRLDGAVAGDHQVTVVPSSSAGDVPGAVVLPETHQVSSQPNDLTITLPR